MTWFKRNTAGLEAGAALVTALVCDGFGRGDGLQGGAHSSLRLSEDDPGRI